MKDNEKPDKLSLKGINDDIRAGADYFRTVRLNQDVRKGQIITEDMLKSEDLELVDGVYVPKKNRSRIE